MVEVIIKMGNGAWSFLFHPGMSLLEMFHACPGTSPEIVWRAWMIAQMM